MALLCCAPWPALAAPSFTACIEPEPPPWAYWVRDQHGRRTNELTGYSVQLLKAVFERLGMSLTIHGEFPWSRCMQMVSTGQIDFAMDAYMDAERANVYVFSRPYRTLTPQVFFLRQSSRPPARLEDLQALKGCGQRGWSYEHYGLSSKNLDLGIGLDGMVRKLKAKRCDFFVEELETVYGARFTGADLLGDPAIGHVAAPWALAPKAHLIAKAGSKAATLMPAINAGLAEAIKSGRAAEFWARHAADLPFKP